MNASPHTCAEAPGELGQAAEPRRPGVVIGDQVATDGILARRLGYAFILFDPQLAGVPAGPRLMGAAGRIVRPMLFTHARHRN